MTETLSFGAATAAPDLPLNYMPAVLPALRGHKSSSACILLPIGGGPDGAAFVAVSGQVLESPTALSNRLAAATVLPALSATLAAEEPSESAAGQDQAVVVIDYGIAHWNRRFVRSDGTPRFGSVGHLAFDTAASGGVRVTMLSQSEIAADCHKARMPGGELALLRTLGQRFPDGFFGQFPNPEGFWHGTAVSDLAGGARPGQTGGPVLFGIDLPTAAVTDSAGDTLQAVLPAALETAFMMTRNIAHLPLTIVLAFGYPGGPHDGSHPIARIIARFLEKTRSQRQVRLVVPAGNHLQDRCAARLPAAAKGMPASSVIWRLPPDDFSGNTVMICTEGSDHPGITLTAPGGLSASITVSPGEFAPVHHNGTLVGGLHFLPRTDGWNRLRLSLTGTGWTAGEPPPAPSGDWQLSVRSDTDADLWVLRDDRSRATDRNRPARRSMFASPAYRPHDERGAYAMADTATGPLLRSGTASILTTAPGVLAVQSDQRIGHLPPETAYYSGRCFDGHPFDRRILVDDGWQGKGCDVVANGRSQRFRMSGTSAAAGIAARDPWLDQDGTLSS
jgi:hypothetical protein